MELAGVLDEVVNTSAYTASKDIMNWKGCGRRRS
jgi:hypothetical protein